MGNNTSSHNSEPAESTAVVKQEKELFKEENSIMIFQQLCAAYQIQDSDKYLEMLNKINFITACELCDILDVDSTVNVQKVLNSLIKWINSGLLDIIQNLDYFPQFELTKNLNPKLEEDYVLLIANSKGMITEVFY